jgi:hypothetical protein
VNIPIEGEPDLPWFYFVLQAARGSPRVPYWVLLAIPAAVGQRLGIPAADVTGDHLEEALGRIPTDPAPFLYVLLGQGGLAVPEPGAAPRLAPEAARGSARDAVASDALLHDAALLLVNDFTRDGFFARVDGTEGPDWDARDAVAAMLFCVLLASA